MTGWVLARDVQNPTQHSDGQRSARLRIFPDGRVLELANGRQLRELTTSADEIDALLDWLVEGARVIELPPAPSGVISVFGLAQNSWDASSSILTIHRGGKIYRKVHTVGRKNPDDGSFKEIGERIKRLTYLAAVGGRESLEKVQVVRGRRTAQAISGVAVGFGGTRMLERRAGRRWDAGSALLFRRGESGRGFPWGNLTVRVPRGGEPFVDRGAVWFSAENAARWGPALEREAAAKGRAD